MSKYIKGFENEIIEVSDYGEWIGNNYIDYKYEYQEKDKEINLYLKIIEEKEKEIEILNDIIKTKDEGIKAFTEDLCEESTKIEKAIEYIEDRLTIENGEYYLTHTFSKDNVKELYDILRGDKE